MSIESSVKKAINHVKDGPPSGQGPARKDQSTAPIADAMRVLGQRHADVLDPGAQRRATSADVKAIAEVCHERDLPIVTDDAWALGRFGE